MGKGTDIITAVGGCRDPYTNESVSMVHVVLLDALSSYTGGFALRCGVVDFLSPNDFLALAETCSALSSTFKLMLERGLLAAMPLPCESHVFASKTRLQWMRKRGYKFKREKLFSDHIFQYNAEPVGTFSKAIKYGSLKMMKYLYKNGVKEPTKDPTPLMLAAQTGSLNKLKWLLEHDYKV